MNGDLTLRRTPRRLVWPLLLLLVALAGCATDAEPEPEATATVAAVEQTEEPVQAPDGVDPPDEDEIPSADTPVAPGPQPPLDGTVLVTLEGPATNRAATDVVIRRETGEVIDAFRLPNATQVHARSGDRWALVEMLDSSWAVLDTAVPRLRLLTFPADVPRADPQMIGPVALWADDEGSLLLRLDGTDALELPADITGQATLEAVSTDGRRALIGGAVPRVLDLDTGRPLDIAAETRFTMAADGTVSSIADTASGGVLQTQGPGEDAPQDVVNLDRPTDAGSEGPDAPVAPEEPVTPDESGALPPAGSRLPVQLADGRFLITGPDSAVVAADGSVAELPATGSTIGIPRLAADGQRVVLATTDGIVIADAAAGTVQVLPDSAGHAIVTPGGRSIVWTISQEPTAPGVIAIDTASAESEFLLPDTATVQVVSVSVDGRAVVVEIDDGTQVRVDARMSTGGDTPESPQVPADLVSLALHPDGLVTATERRLGASQSVDIDRGGEMSTITEAWSPMWLSTGS